MNLKNDIYDFLGYIIPMLILLTAWELDGIECMKHIHGGMVIYYTSVIFTFLGFKILFNYLKG